MTTIPANFSRFNCNHSSLNTNNHVPGQALVLQSVVSVFEPVQSLPPPDGAGLVQVLLLNFFPVPQLLEHVEYSLHSAHLPFTNE